MSDLDPERRHDWRELKVTPLTEVEGSRLLIIDLERESKTTIGCWRCNMSYDEGKEVNCPGVDMFEEDDDASDTGELRSDGGDSLPNIRDIADLGWGEGEDKG